MDNTPTGLADALATLARSRCPQAWERIVHILSGDVHRLALRLTGAYTLAADATQEAFLHLRNGAGHFRPAHPQDDAGARRWALRVTANATLMLLRARKRARRHEQPVVETASHNDQPEAALLRGETMQAVRSALAELPEPQRAILVLHHIEGLSLPDIALCLGVPLGTVKSRLNRGGSALRNHLTRAGLAAGLSASTLLTDLPAADGPPPALETLLRLRDPSFTPTTPAITGTSSMLGFALPFACAVAASLAVFAFTGREAPPTPPVASPPAPLADEPPPPPGPASLRGRITGTVGQVLARLREEGGLDIRDRTWGSENRPLLLFVDAGDGLSADQILARAARLGGLSVHQRVGGGIIVERDAPPPAFTARLEQQLETRPEFSRGAVPLDAAIADLRRQTGIAIAILGVDDPTVPIAMPPAGLRAKEALLWFCRSIEPHLAFTETPDGLALLPLPPAGDQRAILDVSPESACLRRHVGLGVGDFIVRAHPAGWKGGRPVDQRLADGAELLAVSTSAEQWVLVHKLLVQLRQSAATDPWDLIDRLHAGQDRSIADWHREQRRRTAVLDTPVSLRVSEEPIENAIATLQRATGISIAIDPQLCAAPTRITLDLRSRPLHEALTGMGMHHRWMDAGLYLTRQAVQGDCLGPEPHPLDLPRRPGLTPPAEAAPPHQDG